MINENQCTSAIAAGNGTTFRCQKDASHTGRHGNHGDLAPQWGDWEPIVATPQVPCVCGENLVPMDEDRQFPEWTHEKWSDRCKAAIPAAGIPTQADRAELYLQLAETNERLRNAGQDMEDMRTALDSIDDRMRRLDAELVKPSVVRRATLNQVWDRLMDQGHLAAASEVMKMIHKVVD